MGKMKMFLVVVMYLTSLILLVEVMHTSLAFTPKTSLSHTTSNSPIIRRPSPIFCKFRRKQLFHFNIVGCASSHNRRKTFSRRMMQQQPFSNQDNKGLLQILNDEVSDLLLEKLSQKFNGKNSNNNNNNSNMNSNNKKSSSRVFQPSPSLLSSKTTDGLSKFHRNILASTTTRQRCVTGKYPLHISITENPTRKWLSSSSTSPASSTFSANTILRQNKLSLKSTTAGTSQMLVNGTSVDKSLASFDRYQWLDKDEQQTLHQNHTLMSIELVAEIYVKKPGYVNVLSSSTAGYMAEQEEMNPFFENHFFRDKNGKNDENVQDDMYNSNRIATNNEESSTSSSQIIPNYRYQQQQLQEQKLYYKNYKERMWITGFSLTKQSGELHYIDVENGRMGSVNKRSASSIRWPNEVNYVPKPNYVPSSSTTNRNTFIEEPQQQKQQQQGTNIYEDALLVSDGFLVPGKDNGGLYVTLNPGHETSEWNVCLAGGNGVDRLLNKLETRKQQKNNINMANTKTYNDETNAAVSSATTSQVADDDDGWFYHRAVWVDLTNDGRQSILSARAKRPSILKKREKNGSFYNIMNDDNTLSSSSQNKNTNYNTMPAKAQLVWLERPKPHRYDEITGTPLDKDGLIFNPFEPKHTPWKLRVLDEGPDVMFSIADMDTTDDTIEVFASQFFNKKVTMHSIQRGDEPRIVWKRDIDDRCGASFSSILATLDADHTSPTRKVVDCGSTIQTLEQGDDFSHLLVTSHECTFVEEENGGSMSNNNKGSDGFRQSSNNEKDEKNDLVKATTIDGGSLFAYRVPDGKHGWKTKPWTRSVISTGFRVKGQLGNFINPGAPGFW